MNSTPNPALDKIIESSYDRANNKFIVNTSDTTSSVLIAGDDYSGADPAVHNPVYVDANGFLTTDFIQTEHQDINFGFDALASSMTTDGAGSAWSKTNPISTTDDGWYLEGTGLSTLLWYNNGNYQSRVFPIQSNFTFADIDIWFMILKNYFPFNTTNQIMPQIYIYSKPTGSGDFIAGLCHSIWYYTCNSGQSINYGESIMIYTGQLARVKKINPELRRIQYNNYGGGGDRANTEVINHIEFQFNTGFTYKILVQEGGVYVKNQGLLNYYFTTDNPSNADIATIAMKTATDTINTSTSSINTKLTGMTYTSNRLQTQATLVDASGNVATISTPSGASTTIRGLDTQALVCAYDDYNGVYNNLSFVNSANPEPSVVYRALDTYARNPSTTNEYGKSGLNMYQIYPKKIQYLLYAINSNGASNMLLGGIGCTLAINTAIFGKANLQTFSAVLTAGIAPKTVKYHYVNNLGVLKTDGTATLTALNTPVVLGTNYMSINKAWIVIPGATDVLAIRPFNATIAGNTICTSKIDEQYNGIITVPNGYIGYLSAVNVYSPSASWMGTIKWEEDGSRAPSWLAFNTANQNHTGGFGGSLGGIYYPGETIGMARFTSMGGGAMGGMFVLEPI